MKIKSLTLFAKDLPKLKDFYKNVLNLPVAERSGNEFEVQLKNSTLRFVKNPSATSYHFAFTIASNKIESALNQLKKRVEILKNETEEIIDFSAWNAESIYFYDTEENIVEFIVRKNLNNSTEGEFTPDDILEISEIGVATENFNEKFNRLTSIPEVEKFSGGDEVFCAIGSERGLFILIDKNKKDWFPNHDPAFSSDFTVVIETENENFAVYFKNDKINYHSIL